MHAENCQGLNQCSLLQSSCLQWTRQATVWHNSVCSQSQDIRRTRRHFPGCNPTAYMGPYLIRMSVDIQYLLILIIFIWIGNPNICLRLNRRPLAFLLLKVRKKRRAFFEKAHFGVPKPCFRLNRCPQALFFFVFKRHAFLKKISFS